MSRNSRQQESSIDPALIEDDDNMSEPYDDTEFQEGSSEFASSYRSDYYYSTTPQSMSTLLQTYQHRNGREQPDLNSTLPSFSSDALQIALPDPTTEANENPAAVSEHPQYGEAGWGYLGSREDFLLVTAGPSGTTSFVGSGGYGDGKQLCPHCSKLVKRLKRHIEQVHGDPGQTKKHPCPRCHLRFTDRKDLRRHEKTHSRKKVADPCDFCEETFTRTDNKRKHLKNQHPEQFYAQQHAADSLQNEL